MKKLWLATILLISISYSCSNNEPMKKESTSSIDYSALNKSIDNQISTFQNLIVNTNIEDKYLKYFKTEPLISGTNKNIEKEKLLKLN